MRHTIHINDDYLTSLYFNDELGFTMDIKLTDEKKIEQLRDVILFMKTGFDEEKKLYFSIDNNSTQTVKIIGNIPQALEMLENLKLLSKPILFQIRTDKKLQDFFANSKKVSDLKEEKPQRISPKV